MKIIIAGAGDVGFHLAKLLAWEDLDITLIDIDQEKLRYASDHLDVASVKGEATSYLALEEANVAKADLFISATFSQDTNLTSAMIAKHLGAKKTVARIQNEEFLFRKEKLDLQKLGIDELISPETLAAREIKRLISRAALTDSFDFDDGLLSLIGISIEKDSPLAYKSLIETAPLNPNNDFITVAILRNNQTIIPRGTTRFEIGDHAYFIAEPEGVRHVTKLTGKDSIQIKNIMILGGGKAGHHAARKLAPNYRVKMVESDKEKCFQLADELPEVLVIHGDGRDVELLEEEGIANMDAFVALTGDSETNIISCLVAKNHGVSKTISLVENMDYIHLSQNIGVDTMINKKLIAANFIFRYIRQGDIISVASMQGVEAEIDEFEVKAHSKITHKKLREVKFPREAIVGGVIRYEKGYIAMGDFEFRAGDRVVVLTTQSCIHEVEDLFK